RQQVDRVRGKFSMLLFDQTTLDVGSATGNNANRWREPRERYLNELFNPTDTRPSEPYYADLIAEGHSRIVQPLLPITCATVALAILLTGSYSRRGQAVDILKAIGLTVLILVASLGTRSLAGKQPIIIYMMYASVVLPFLISFCYLLWPRELKPSWLARRALKQSELT
ncbi:MAG: LptF/LptG family permease, partial [Pseudomonadota bacterium]|nr:LptF/LptG family permease [Pseudomonadota bacterium]